MRNLFDQYDGPENRVTHALACCLAEDPRLLRRFIRWATGTAPPKAGRLRIVQQQVPGEPVIEDDGEERGLPDAWIYGEGPWSLIIESKVAAPVAAGQLRRHLGMAARHGFTDARLLVLSPKQSGPLPPRAVHRPWTEVYAWAGREAGRGSVWAARLVEYLEVAEVKMVAKAYLTDGMLTRFNGFRFDQEHPYTYREGKRLLNLATAALRGRADLRRLGVDPSGEGRPAITGSEGRAVWDFLQLRSARRDTQFIRHPHLTLAVHRDYLEAFVTVPSAVKSSYRRGLQDLGPEGFAELLRDLCRALGPVVRSAPGASPRFYALQRHYKSQRSTPEDDARIDFDLRTILAKGAGRVKPQPQWGAAVFEAFTRKRSNLQLGAGVRFPYEARGIGSPEALRLIAGSWIGCRPLLKALGAV